jgi:hypothetical protein
MGAFSFAWPASGIPEAFLERSGVPVPTPPEDTGLQERQQYCLFIFIPAQDFDYQAC